MFNNRQFRALTKAMLLMDLRGQHYSRATGTKPGELIPPLFWVIGQFLFASAVLSIALFARVDAWGFAFANLSAGLLLTLSAVVVEFNEVVLNADDLYVLGHRPVSQKTYSAARLANLGVFLFVIFVALSIFPVIIGTQIRDGGGWWVVTYLIANFVVVFGTAAAVLLLYTFSPPKQGENDWRDLLAWLQIILALVFFYGAQFMFRDTEYQVQVFLNYPPDWVRWLPTAPLADFVSENARRLSGTFLLKTFLFSSITVVLLVALLFRLMYFYRRLRPFLAAASGSLSKISGSFWLRSGIAKRLAVSRAEWAGLQLGFTMLRRDRELLMRSLPSLGTALAVLLLGLGTGQFGDPVAAVAVGKTEILPIALSQFLVISVPVVLHNFLYSKSHESSWLLQVAPRMQPFVFGDAIEKVVLLSIYLPVLFGLLLLSTWLWQDVVHASLHWGITFFEILLFGTWAVRGIPLRIPFSRPAERGSIGGGIAPFLAAISLSAMMLGAVQFFAYRFGSMGALMLLCLLVLFAVVLRRWAK